MISCKTVVHQKEPSVCLTKFCFAIYIKAYQNFSTFFIWLGRLLMVIKIFLPGFLHIKPHLYADMDADSDRDALKNYPI